MEIAPNATAKMSGAAGRPRHKTNSSTTKKFKGDNKKMGLQVSRAGKKLKVEIPMEKPWRSSTGKTWILATSGGLMRTGIKVNGQDVFILFNVLIKNSGGADLGDTDTPTVARTKAVRRKVDAEEEE